MVSLSADVDAILDAGVPDPKAIPAEPSKDTMLAALFQTTAVQPPPPRDHAKRHRTREDDESHSRSILSWRLREEPRSWMRRPDR